MKINLFLLMMFSFGNIAFSQNLSLSQILSVRELDPGEAEEYLTERKWELLNAKKPDGDIFGSLEFLYRVNTKDDKDESFLNIYYPNNFRNDNKISFSENRVSFQVIKESKYKEYLNHIKSRGGIMKKSYINDNSLYKVYEDSTMTYVISSFTQNKGLANEINGYDFFIFTNRDYYFHQLSRK